MLMTDEQEYDNGEGRYWRIGYRLHFAHTGKGPIDGYWDSHRNVGCSLPRGLNYDMSTIVLNYIHSNHRPWVGSVTVIGWSNDIVLPSSEDMHNTDKQKLSAAMAALETIMGKQSAKLLVEAFMAKENKESK